MNCIVRYLKALVCALSLALTPLVAQAHDGPHNLDVLAVVNAATTKGHSVTVSLTVTGLGGPLVLTGLSAAGARRIDLDPIYVDFAQDVEVQAILDFTAPPPGAFTLELDFGPVGQGTVSVVPELVGQ